MNDSSSPPSGRSLTRLDTPSREAIRGSKGRARLHLHVGQVCNNDCLFCIEEDRELRYVVNSGMTQSRAVEILELERNSAGITEVVFTSGEPTLREELPALARCARELGYTRVGLMTNGRRLGTPGYLSALMDSGINGFLVGLHGATAQTHDAIVGSDGAFAQTLEGLEQLAKLRPRLQRLATSTVMINANLGELASLYERMAQLGIGVCHFDGLMARGRVPNNFERLFPPYPVVYEALREVLAKEVPETAIEIAGLPRCVVRDFPETNLCAPEHFESLELDDGLPSAAASSCGRPTEDGRFLVLESDRLDSLDRVKHSSCDDCVFVEGCPGIYRSYISHFGWDHIAPVLSH